MIVLAAENGTEWPEAAIAIAGIAFITIVAFVVVSQVFATWRARVSVAREEAYRKLAEDASEEGRKVADALERTASELAGLRTRTAEIERLMKEVE